MMQALATETLLDVRGLTMCFPNGFRALDGIDLRVQAGELTVILGSNGSGKSTLLKCIVRLLSPTSGTISVAGEDLCALRGKALREARRAVALVSQRANLVGRRSVLANVVTGTLGRHNDWRSALGMLPRDEFAFARKQLEVVGLADKAAQRAGTLSGGQAQRVSIGRALAQRPRLLLADEPIASLDPEAADDVLGLLRRLAHEGLAVVCVLHQPDLALQYADRLIGLRAGSIAFDSPVGAVSTPLVSALYANEAA